MKTLRLVLFTCAVLALCAPTFGDGVPRAAFTSDFAQLEADGWTETGPGVYQRSVDGRLQVLAYGDAGPRIELGWIETQIDLLTESFELSGSAEVAITLQELEQRRDELVDAMRRDVERRLVDDTSFLGQDVSGLDQAICDPQGSANATTGYASNGPEAAASTTYSESCNRNGSVYCYAFARAYQGTVYNDGTQADGPRGVTGSGSCSVSKSVPGDNNCFATSTAQVDFTDDDGNPATFFERASTTECGPPLDVWITSSDFVRIGNVYDITVPYNDCVFGTFQANSNRSNTAFSWLWDGSASSTFATRFRKYCDDSSLWGTSEYHTLRLTGTVSGSSDHEEVGVSVHYSDPR